MTSCGLELEAGGHAAFALEGLALLIRQGALKGQRVSTQIEGCANDAGIERFDLMA